MGKRRFYSEADKANMRAWREQGLSLSEIARRLDRDYYSIANACARMGIKAPDEVIRANRIRVNSARKGEKRPNQKPMTAEQRAAKAELMRSIHLDPVLDARRRERSIAGRRTPESREKSRQARLAQLGETYDWLPPKFRDEFFALRRKGLTFAERKALLLPEINRWLQTFDGQLWKLQTGKARLVRNERYGPAQAYVPTQLQGAMT